MPLVGSRSWSLLRDWCSVVWSCNVLRLPNGLVHSSLAHLEKLSLVWVFSEGLMPLVGPNVLWLSGVCVLSGGLGLPGVCVLSDGLGLVAIFSSRSFIILTVFEADGEH